MDKYYLEGIAENMDFRRMKVLPETIDGREGRVVGNIGFPTIAATLINTTQKERGVGLAEGGKVSPPGPSQARENDYHLKLQSFTLIH